MSSPVVIPTAPPPEVHRRRRPAAKLRQTGVVTRIRVLTAAAVVAVAALFATAAVAADDAATGLATVGHNAGPQVITTADLYYGLAEMDGLVAAVLLTGEEADREETEADYAAKRALAHRAVVEAADLAAQNDVDQQTVADVLAGLGRYEQLVARAQQLSEQQPYPQGQASPEVLELYREATDVMRLDLLPKAYNLTLESGTIVRLAHKESSDAVGRGIALLAAAAIGTLLLLAALQLLLARRFRRMVNLPLALATVTILGAVIYGAAQLGGAVDELDRAKTDGVDAVLDLSRARAISSSMAGDQSRYLLDQETATTYQQIYFDKAQSVLYRPAPNLRVYTAELAQIDPAADSLGLLGGGGMQDVRVLFADYQQSDGQLRELARDGQTEAAIAVRLGDSATDFATVDSALVAMIDEHRTEFSTAIDAGERAIGGWGAGSSIVALLAAGLIVVGVRPRLAEYR